MASRRFLKKVINSQIADVIDHCYDVMIESPDKKEKMNAIIDESVELYDGLIEAVNAYRSAENKPTYFSEIESKLIKEVDALNGKVTRL
jgi:cysteinyl-tRNA synthetase